MQERMSCGPSHHVHCTAVSGLHYMPKQQRRSCTLSRTPMNRHFLMLGLGISPEHAARCIGLLHDAVSGSSSDAGAVQRPCSLPPSCVAHCAEMALALQPVSYFESLEDDACAKLRRAPCLEPSMCFAALQLLTGDTAGAAYQQQLMSTVAACAAPAATAWCNRMMHVFNANWSVSLKPCQNACDSH
jgi:hypothetical protein